MNIRGVLMVLVLMSGAKATLAGEIFLDDFGDGSVTNELPLATDGTAVKWTEHGAGSYDASSGDYVLTPVAESNDFLVSSPLDFSPLDTSVRVQGKATGDDTTSLIVSVRNQGPTLGDRHSYAGGIGYFQNLGGTVLFLGVNDPDYTPLTENLVMPFDIRQEDAVIQLDVIGNSLSLWAWPAGDSPPEHPQLTATDDTFSTAGPIRIVGDRDGTATFRYVQLADEHIPVPEPSALSLMAVGVFVTWQRGRRGKRHHAMLCR